MKDYYEEKTQRAGQETNMKTEKHKKEKERTTRKLRTNFRVEDVTVFISYKRDNQLSK